MADITFTSPRGETQAYQNVRRCARGDRGDYDFPENHQAPWELEDYEGNEFTVGWDYVVDSITDERDR